MYRTVRCHKLCQSLIKPMFTRASCNVKALGLLQRRDHDVREKGIPHGNVNPMEIPWERDKSYVNRGNRNRRENNV